MKRLIAFLVFIVVAGVVALLLTTFPANRETIFPGYMEADLVLVGSEQGGRVETLSVQEGDSLEKAARIFGIGHLMELPARMAWDQDLWVGATVQGGFFALSGPLGVLLQVFTIIGLIVLAVLLRRYVVSGLPFTILAAVLFAIGLLVWWIFVYPVNVELAKWVNGPVPGDWADWRQLWEWGQAANGLAQFAGFAALIASVLVMKVKKTRRPRRGAELSFPHPSHGIVANPFQLPPPRPAMACI